MGCTNSRATMKCLDQNTKKFRYSLPAKVDEHKNKFGKGWSPGSELMLVKNTPTSPTLKIDLSDHPFIKDDIFDANSNLPPRGTPIGIIAQYW